MPGACKLDCATSFFLATCMHEHHFATSAITNSMFREQSRRITSYVQSCSAFVCQLVNTVVVISTNDNSSSILNILFIHSPSHKNVPTGANFLYWLNMVYAYNRPLHEHISFQPSHRLFQSSRLSGKIFYSLLTFASKYFI
jgi:hypothetical protein